MRLGTARVGFVLMWLALPLSDGPTASVDTLSLKTAQGADSIKIVLSEVLFAPRSDDTSFVELANVGTGALDLADFVLRVDTLELPLPSLASPVAPGARVLIRFDGPRPTEANVVHASSAFALRAEGGVVAMLTNDDRVLDRVAWGDAVDAIVPVIGSMPVARIDPGSSFGRPPGANQPGANTDWVLYPPDQVTPGQPNPLPAVSQLLPLDGAILQATPIELSWYPVPGAVRYRVQLSRDSTFAQTILDQTVDAPKVSSGQLAAAMYWWRVQAIAADGPPAAWSPPSRIECETGAPGGDDNDGSESNDLDDENASPLGGEHLQSTKPVVLPVPQLYQHKDSHMLLLELQQSGGPRPATLQPPNPHAWDRDHGTLDPTDPADNMSCGLASMAMVNNYYSGDLAQDRIGYEVFGPNVRKYQAMIPPGLVVHGPLHERAPGPDRDLMYGYGLWDEELVAAGIYALGATPGPGSGFGPGFTVLSTMWSTIVTEIDAKRPVIGRTKAHYLVIRGYEVKNGQRRIWVNDPWFGQYPMYFDLGSAALGKVLAIYTWPNHPAIGRLEPEVSRDSDGDRVYDFDEINRFHTDPHNTDSDADGVRDYQDIESGVYEDEFRLGYAWNPSYGSPGRDFDADGIATELDPDSDNGGCKDGEEDTSASGFRENRETSNFNQSDDMCGTLRGSLNYKAAVVSTDPNQTIRVIHDEGVILVRLKPESPGSDHYVDDSSTFNYLGFARIETGVPTCKIVGREFATGGGLIAKWDGEIAATRGNDGRLALGAGAQVKGHSSVAGCGVGGSDDAVRGMSWPGTCDGKLAPTSPKGTLTYQFDCTTVTAPTGMRVTHYHAHGFVRVQVP